MAAIRGRSLESIGIPCSRAMLRKARDWRSGVKPFSGYSSGDSERPTIRSRHSIRSP